MVLTFLTSMFCALKAEHEWARRMSLISMLIVQVSMAAWVILADPMDRLDGAMCCLVSLLEACAMSILLAAYYLTDTMRLKGMGLVAVCLLIMAVFFPIGLSIYDNVLLPAASAYQTRKDKGESTCRAVVGILVHNLLLPVVILANAFGWSFNGIDVMEAVFGEADTTVSDGAMAKRAVSQKGLLGTKLRVSAPNETDKTSASLAMVLMLQNAWRQRQSRCQLQQRRAELAEAAAKMRAATRLQAVLRRRRTARNVIQLKAVRTVQNSYRAHVQNRQLNVAVVRMQAAWRGRVVRRASEIPKDGAATFITKMDLQAGMSRIDSNNLSYLGRKSVAVYENGAGLYIKPTSVQSRPTSSSMSSSPTTYKQASPQYPWTRKVGVQAL